MQKNYFYFLGLDEQASEEEIKKNYRKLSLKYHPDKNENDPFFEARFRELKEAYEILINPEQRRLHADSIRENKKNIYSGIPPIIKTFESDKIFVQKNEKILLKWITQNADLVKIHPFGLMPSYGEKAFKITSFVDGKFQIILHAQNTYLKKTVVKGIILYEGVQEENKADIHHEEVSIFSLRKQKQNRLHPLQRIALILLMIVIIVIAILNLF